jgi:hypothetical protein
LEDVESVKEDVEATKRPAKFLEDDEGLEVGLYNIVDPSTNVSEV